MMNNERLAGLVAATYTPLDQTGAVDASAVGPMVEFLLGSGIRGLYVCGSTGEGMSLSTEERQVVAEAYVRAANGRVPVIVQVGHNSLADAKRLATHAAEIGADIISATCPSYFKVGNVEGLVDCMAEVAEAAPGLPFYYYHIPVLTGSNLDILHFLKIGGDRIANLAGLKYTDTKLHEFQQCLELEDGRFDVVWGCDEMLLGALATGARAAIGSTYNIAAPLYHRLMTAFMDGDLQEARRLQGLSIKMICAINRFPFHPAMKDVLAMGGFSVGRCRLPQESLAMADVDALQSELELMGFFEWSSLTRVSSSS